MNRVFLVDGTALVYRAHFAFIRNPLINSKGQTVSAVYGFASALVQLLRDEHPGRMGVAFDLGAPTFRHEQFAEYKATRPPMPDELSAQFPRVRELVRAFGLRILEREGFEADDLIGCFNEMARAQGYEVVIVSSDKDFMQLLDEGTRQWIPPYAGGEGQWVDAAGVRERWGVGPERMVDLLALVGDTSDNVPGVAGVGPKTAAQLLDQYGSLDGVYAHLGEIGRPALRAKLEAGRENAFLSRELVRIRCDLPPLCGLDELLVPPLSSCPRLAPLLEELEFRKLAESLGVHQAAEWIHETTVADTEDALVSALARWAESPRPLCVEARAAAAGARVACPVGVALSWEAGGAVYVPLAHREGRNLPLDVFTRRLAPVLADPATVLVGQNVKADLHALACAGLRPPAGAVRDTLLAAYLLDPDSSHRLDALSRDHLQHILTPITDLTGKGRKQLPIEEIGIEPLAQVAGESVDATLRLSSILERKLGETGLAVLWRDLECPLVPVLLRMEQAGVGIDRDFLGLLSVSLQTDIDRLAREIVDAAGTDFNINSPAQLAKVLFDVLRLPAGRRTRTGRSTDSEVLEELAEVHPVPKLVLQHRTLCKLKGTYIDALPLLVDPHTGRIHATLNQTVAATGRLSSSDPNLQNIPIRSPLGREIRKAFVAAPGHVLLSADYSQIELRVLAHLSKDEALRSAFLAGFDVHAATASRIFGVAPEQVDPGMRARAKVVNFGVIYGMGPVRLARELGIELGEARAFIAAYFAGMPGVRRWLEENLERARRDGYVTTLFGRKRWMRGLTGSDARLRAQLERAVANTPVQGSAADLIKRAMLSVDRLLGERGLATRMILQVHDELVLEAPEAEADRAEALIREAMEGAAELDVPLRVDIGRGRSWAQAHP